MKTRLPQLWQTLDIFNDLAPASIIMNASATPSTMPHDIVS